MNYEALIRAISQAHTQAQTDCRQTETQHPSGHTQHQAFELHLAQDGTCARSERQAYRDLAAAPDGANQQ